VVRPANRTAGQYSFPADTSGFAKGEIDQPEPVPGFNWQY
jgi:hypothetical protein